MPILKTLQGQLLCKLLFLIPDWVYWLSASCLAVFTVLRDGSITDHSGSCDGPSLVLCCSGKSTAMHSLSTPSSQWPSSLQPRFCSSPGHENTTRSFFYVSGYNHSMVSHLADVIHLLPSCFPSSLITRQRDLFLKVLHSSLLLGMFNDTQSLPQYDFKI